MDYLIKDLSDIVDQYIHMDPVVLELQKFDLFKNHPIKSLEKVSDKLTKEVMDDCKCIIHDYGPYNDLVNSTIALIFEEITDGLEHIKRAIFDTTQKVRDKSVVINELKKYDALSEISSTDDVNELVLRLMCEAVG